MIDVLVSDAHGVRNAADRGSSAASPRGYTARTAGSPRDRERTAWTARRRGTRRVGATAGPPTPTTIATGTATLHGRARSRDRRRGRGTAGRAPRALHAARGRVGSADRLGVRHRGLVRRRARSLRPAWRRRITCRSERPGSVSLRRSAGSAAAALGGDRRAAALRRARDRSSADRVRSELRRHASDRTLRRCRPTNWRTESVPPARAPPPSTAVGARGMPAGLRETATDQDLLADSGDRHAPSRSRPRACNAAKTAASRYPSADFRSLAQKIRRTRRLLPLRSRGCCAGTSGCGSDRRARGRRAGTAPSRHARSVARLASR